jgi:hypothetical protein
MKKSVLYSLIASMSMISAAASAAPVADDSTASLTTKGYVDAGLKYVYDAINGDVTNLQTALSDGNGGLVDVGDLATTVGATGTGENPSTGLVGDVEELQDKIGTATAGNVPGTGLTGRVENLENAVETLDNLGTDDLDANKKYILQTDGQGQGSWSEIAIESTWNPEAFENNVMGNN